MCNKIGGRVKLNRDSLRLSVRCLNGGRPKGTVAYLILSELVVGLVDRTLEVTNTFTQGTATVLVVILSLAPIFFESGIGNDVMEPIAVPIVGGMVTSSVAVLILLPVLFAMLKERARRAGKLRVSRLGIIVSTEN